MDHGGRDYPERVQKIACAAMTLADDELVSSLVGGWLSLLFKSSAGFSRVER
jgi:hypothetical protein